MANSLFERFELQFLTHCLVEIKIKARKVWVKGPRGEITKDFTHIQCDISLQDMATKKISGKHVRVAIWNGQYRRICSVKTIIGLIRNMFIGTTEVSSLNYAPAVLRTLIDAGGGER